MIRDRKRNRCNRKSKRVILVAYEGKNKTEKLYFQNFQDRKNDYVIKIVPGNETDPLSLVKQTIKKIKELKLKKDDKSYLIFDADTDILKNKVINEVIEIANNNNIIPIISVPSFELWFLLHFEYTTKFLTNDLVIEELKKYYSKYEKNCDLYDVIKDNTNKAIINAKRLEQFQLRNNKILQSVDVNPYTEVYKIIEDLIQKN